MSTAATSRYPTSNVTETSPSQLSEDELGKLQEIHELINMMFRELSTSTQPAAQSYFTPQISLSPHTHTYYPWRMSQYLAPPGY